MNPIERAIRRVDAAQQRHKASAFVFGVIKKYGDDNGACLPPASPTILGLVASGDPALRHEALNAVAKQVR